MNIEEIKKEKRIMQDKICAVIKEFIDRTDVHPDEIEINLSVVAGFGDRQTIISGVVVKVII